MLAFLALLGAAIAGAYISLPMVAGAVVVDMWSWGVAALIARQKFS